MDYKRKKIVVAISGGVDSAMAAALLKKRGFDVIGVYFRFFNGAQASESQAKKIAKKLKFPLKIVDARKNFKKKVIKYFLDSYRNGLTPNPCVVCNKEMKFRLLFDLMKKEKAAYVATGHYARIRKLQNLKDIKYQTKPHTQAPKHKNISKLLQGRDKQKDQSYFLYKLNQKDLEKIIFPLGELKKEEVRKMAKKIKLPVVKNDSQDVCFVGNNSANGFLKKNIKGEAGKIVDTKGNALGKHKGLPLYTIGQRKGIEIGSKGPFFVLRKDVRINELVVTSNRKDLLTKEFHLGKVNWVYSKTKLPLRAKVQIRYHAERIPAIIKKDTGGKYVVAAGKPLRAVTNGQSAVFYRGGEVIGGGVII
jgi:tRNA-uridine 2-sulfurtransferase